MKSDNPNDIFLKCLVILLSIIVLAASIIYLMTDKIVPGFIPLCSSALIIPMVVIFRKQENGRMYSIIFLAGSILNLIAGIMQILEAI